MKNYYLKPLKCLLVWVLFLSITPIMAQEVPEYINVSGLPSYSPFNGVYKKADTYGAYGHASWRSMDLNGGYRYIYSDYYMGINCWMLGYRNSNNSILYWSYYSNGNDYSWGDQNSFKPLVSPLMMETWMLYDWGNGTETPVSITLNEVVAPTLVPTTASSITTVSASLGGNITSDGGDYVYERGIVYSSTDDTPTMNETGVTDDYNGSGKGEFSETITGLSPATTYYYQAYAYNVAGITYGGVQQFTTAALPVISSVAVPTNATYVAGQNLDFMVNFNKAITVVTTGGTPFIPITLATGGTLSAAYYSGSGTSALTFRYTVAAGNNDADGITVGSAITANGGILKDGLGNNATLTLISMGSTTGVKVDAIKPTATISLSDAALKAGETATVTFTFSEAVTGFITADLTVANGSVSGLSSSDGGITWTATFTPSASVVDATNVITLDNTGVSDTAGNAGTGTTNSPNYAIDTVNPSVTITSTTAAITYTNPIPVTVTFSEEVTGFISSDVTVTNGTLKTFAGNGATYTFTITPSTQGLVTVAIAGSVAQDLAGNNNTAATSLTRTFDSVNPTVVVSTTATEPTKLTSFPITITFSEAVTGLALTDFTVVNATLSALSGSGTTYTLTATPTVQGTVSISLGSGMVLDVAQLGNVASNQLNRTFDSVAPLISGVTNNGTYTSAQAPTFNEGTATLAKNGGTAAVFTSGTSIGATGNYVLKVTDAAGNVTTASFAITITTGVDDQRETSLVIYPNPCTDGFNVLGIDAPANVTIADLTGRVVVNTMVDVDGVVPVSSLKQGTYLVKVNNRVLKLIKK